MIDITVTVNGTAHKASVEPRTLLVEFVREKLRLTGTHVGCDTSQCGACTVHLEGQPVRSCSTPIGGADGKRVTTIEGLKSADGQLHPVQAAWIAEQVPQCGYCQSGQLMAAASLLAKHPKPSDAEIDAEMSPILCRCGTYQRIRKAIHRAAGGGGR